jgi:hypothetical protein
MTFGTTLVQNVKCQGLKRIDLAENEVKKYDFGSRLMDLPVVYVWNISYLSELLITFQ